MRAREGLAAICVLPLVVAACGWSPSRPFDREAPEVNEAIGELDAGDASAAAETLESYLSTGACKEGSIGLPESVRRLPSGSFDLGLALFRVGEAFGQRFGDESKGKGKDTQGADEVHERRAAQIACALSVVQHVASDDGAPLELRARARYLEGNLDFLGGDYEAAVAAYDQALTLAPGIVDAGDPVGRDAAWNRAIALRRIDDEKDAGNDASPPDSGPGDGSSSPPDGSSPPDSGKGDSGSNGGGQDASSPRSPDASSDQGGDASTPPPEPPDAGPTPQPKQTQDDRVLDQLENAPTVQQEDAKKRAAQRRVRGADDK